MRKRDFIISLILLAVSSYPAAAQKMGNTFAAGGPAGIYVALGKELPTPAHPVGGGVAYLVERRVSGQSEWHTVATVGAPTSLNEFRSRLLSHIGQAREGMSLKEIPVDTLWNLIDRYGIADSLKFWSGVLVVRLAAGMMYLDTTARAGVHYQYRVSLVNSSRRAVATLVSNVMSFPQTPRLPKLHLFDKSAKPKEVTLEWTSGLGRGAPTFTVYRQDSLRGGYHLVTPLRLLSSRRDSIFYFVQDTLVEPMNAYRYYVIPADYYGNPGSPSDTAMIGTYDFYNVPLPDNLHVTSLDSIGGLRISWRLRNARLVRNLTLFRSVDYDTGYHKLADIATQDTSYTDQTVVAMRKYFYYLVIRGPLGETSPPSAKMFGMYVSSVAPLAPGIIGAEGLKNGVRIRIAATDIHQSDFQIYRSDGYRPGLRLISGLVPRRDSITDYVDTSSVLSGKLTYAYAVRSENSSHVFSGFSDTVHVRPLIPTHPPTPLGLNSAVEGKAIQLYWEDMQSADNSLEGYFIYRREVRRGRRPSKFAKLNDSLLAADRNQFTDTTAYAGNIYEYTVQAYDIFGGRSALSATTRAEIAAVTPIPPGGLRARSTRGGILLQWDETVQPNVKEYRVYRYERRRRVVRISTVRSPGKTEVLDSGARRGRLYFYFVTTVNKDGIESGRSEEVGVRR